MAVIETYNFNTNELARHSKFFPTSIYVPHPQLRNFISTVYENQIYFAHGFDVYVINLLSNQQSLVATVPFEARCLAAAHGWVCVGGETKGDCAFVKISDDGHDTGIQGVDLVVDMLGKEIVNSMTIHKIPAIRVNQEDEVVVLISNNDKTVTLYSLSQQQILSVLDHPVAMNYASMSPDCTIIAAVGDSHEVFFYKRQELDGGRDVKTKLRDYAEYSWCKLANPIVPSGEGVGDDYSFAVAFSTTGRFCAVSAQGGYITVLDMELLVANCDQPGISLIATFRSSRSSLWGCVRSISFSPEPWDLLAWTEDHGRIGIADIRRKFARRQCLLLEQESCDSIKLQDVTPAEFQNHDVKERLRQQHLRRVRTMRGHVPVGARSFDEAQQLQTQSENFPLDRSMDLDRQERSVLEALEATIENVEAHPMRPYSVNYTSSPSLRPSAIPSTGRERDIQLLNPGSLSSIGLPMPQRTNSVILSAPSAERHLSPPENLRAFISASPAPMSDDTTTPPMSTNDLTPSRGTDSSQPMPYNIPPSDPWHVIEAAMRNSRASQSGRPAPVQGVSSSLSQIESAIMAERRIANRLERQLADERRLSALLRTELEARERLLEARQQQIQAAARDGNGMSPSLERVLQRQLQLEVESGRQRSSELESAMHINSQRLERLSNARDTLADQPRRLGSNRRNENLEALAPPMVNSTNAELRQLEATLVHLEEDRRARRQRIQELETQVRRAESRVELASIQHNVERPQQRDRYHERLLDANFLNAARGGGTNSGVGWRLVYDNISTSDATDNAGGPSQQQTAAVEIRGPFLRRAEAAIAASRSMMPQTSELAGRVSELDMQFARTMLQRASMDENGNWTAGHGFRRLLGSTARSSAVPGAHQRRGTLETQSIEEIIREERGLGTAGIGWSPDGRFLYVGSQAGIFEFKISTKDRMCFPSFEFR